MTTNVTQLDNSTTTQQSKTKSKQIETADDENDNYEDAISTLQLQGAHHKELLCEAEETNCLMHMFISNRHEEVEQLVKPLADKGIYYSLARATAAFIKGFLIYEQEQMLKSLEDVKKSVDVCLRKRRQVSVSNNIVTKIVKRPNYNLYTEEEVHAELCYAECLLMKTLMTVILDPTLVSLVKSGVRIRLLYQSYKECEDMLEHRTWLNETLKQHFEGGVKMGLGAFNLLISCLPGRYIKLVELVGFSGDRDLGIKLLRESAAETKRIRGPLSGLMLFAYFAGVQVVMGSSDYQDNLSYAQFIVDKMVAAHPDSFMVQFCVGRMQSVNSKIHEAIASLQHAINLKVDWEKFKHTAMWEIFWCHAVLEEWRTCLYYIDILWRESQWSKCVYGYMKAAILTMCNDLSDKEQKEIVTLMRDVPIKLQRIAGKSIPIEKYFVKRAQRFLAQGNWLMLPLYEMMYVFNYFSILNGQQEFLGAILKSVDRGLENLKQKQSEGLPFYMDSYCLGIFLKGLCLRLMGSPLSAEEFFVEIYINGKHLKEDKHLLSFALMELGIICKESENYDQAVEYFHAAKEHKVFYTEFRIHSELHEIHHRSNWSNSSSYSLPAMQLQASSYRSLPEDHDIETKLENTHM